jgi:hypothetical protein
MRTIFKTYFMIARDEYSADSGMLHGIQLSRRLSSRNQARKALRRAAKRCPDAYWMRVRVRVAHH